MIERYVFRERERESKLSLPEDEIGKLVSRDRKL